MVIKRILSLSFLFLFGLMACIRSEEATQPVKLKIHDLYSARDYIYGEDVDSLLFSEDIVRRIWSVRETTEADRERISKSEDNLTGFCNLRMESMVG